MATKRKSVGAPKKKAGERKTFVPVGIENKKLNMLGYDNCKAIAYDAISESYIQAKNVTK